MKRGAEKQLTQLNHDVDDDDEGSEERGFRKADDSVLATRVIKGLPKRAGAVTAPAPVASNPFGSFGAPAAKPAETPAASSGFSFNSKPSGSIFGGATSSPPAATNTSKAFASMLSGTTSSTGSGNLFGAPTTALSQPAPSLVSSFGTAKPAENAEHELKYYTSLRGLNLSLMNSVSAAVDKDPFVDLSTLLQQYKDFRVKVQKEYDAKTTTSTSSSPSAPSTAPAQEKPPTTNGTASFGGFGTAPTSSAPMSFGASSTKTNSTFGFGASSTESKPADTKPASTPFTFGPSSSSPETKSTTSFGFGSSSSADSKPAGIPFTFGASKPTAEAPKSDGPIASLPFTFGAPSTNGTDASKASSSSPFSAPFSGSITFGGSSAKSTTTTTSSSSSLFAAPPSEPFTFGGSKPSFFGGGAASAASSSFGSITSADNEASRGSTPATEVKVEPTTGDESGEPPALGTNPNDEEGEGEEHEVTTHAVKLKAFRMRKADGEEKPGWAELGVGFLRLKKEKEGNARRVLMRNSANGRVVLNFRIYSALSPTVNKKTVTLIGHDNGQPVSYCLRTSTEDQAKELKEALAREAAAV